MSRAALDHVAVVCRAALPAVALAIVISRPEEIGYAACQSCGRARPAFPNDEYLPARPPELHYPSAIPSYITQAFFPPKCGIRRRRYFAIATPVHVPEATMHKDCLLYARYNYVGLSGQCFSMKAVANAQPTQQCTHSHFRLGVLASNRSHAAAALLACKDIRHAKRFLTKPTNSSNSRSFMSERGYRL